jgi:hypothetical protein
MGHRLILRFIRIGAVMELGKMTLAVTCSWGQATVPDY